MSTNKFLACNFSRIMNQIIQVGSVPIHSTCQDFPTNIYRNRNRKKTFMKPESAQGKKRKGKKKKKGKKPQNTKADHPLFNTQSNRILSTPFLRTQASTFTTLTPSDGVLLLSVH